VEVVTKGARSLCSEIVASMCICGETCVDLVVMERLLNSYDGKSKCYSDSLFVMERDIRVEVVHCKSCSWYP